MASIQEILRRAEAEEGYHYWNPRLPINIPLPEGIQNDQRIYIHGTVAASPDRFAINLQNQQDSSSADVLLHFNPRFYEPPVVVRNSRISDDWGQEEREGDSPFVEGTPFVIVFTGSSEGYQVEVNGKHFTTYVHRDGAPMEEVRNIAIHDDVIIHAIHIPKTNVPKPLQMHVPGKVKIGDMFQIKGTVPTDPFRFLVNLQCGDDEKTADVAFHFNPRFSDNVIVRNTRVGDEWGEEERSGGMPLQAGEDFTLQIAVAKDKFLIWVNGNLFATLIHRMDIKKACKFHVDGDVIVHDATVDSAPVTLPPELKYEKPMDSNSAAFETFKPENPAIRRLEGGQQPGNVYAVTGILDRDAKRIKINLQTDETPEADIALHYNPRFDQGKVVIQNTRENGTWADETITTKFPFNQGGRFDVQIIAHDDGYKVVVNGALHSEYPHVVNPERVDSILVDGSVSVQRIIAF